MSRVPLWLTLVPLAAGALLWLGLWRAHADRFAAELAPLLPAGATVETGGFPYRLQGRVAPLSVRHRGPALELRFDAAEAVANRVPWQRERTVAVLRDSELGLALAPIPAASMGVRAPGVRASLRTADGAIARLSVVWSEPLLRSGLLPVAVTAQTLEAHLRETPAAGDGGTSPRLPTQDLLSISGSAVRLGDGDPLALGIDAEVTASRPVRSLAAWLDGGSVEIRRLLLSDPAGEVLRLSATVVPDGAGGLVVAGTIETVCPATVRAAIGAVPAPSEARLRRPQRIAFSGRLPGGVGLAAAAEGAPAAVRAQQPPCPRLR